jgi:hypothetical protein
MTERFNSSSARLAGKRSRYKAEALAAVFARVSSHPVLHVLGNNHNFAVDYAIANSVAG